MLSDDRYDNLENYSWLMGEIIRHELPQSKALGEYLLDYLRPGSVIDIGCGPGIYLLPFAAGGCEILGVDGSPAAGQCLEPKDFVLADFRTDWRPGKRYDLALCIEVAEHLRPEYADNIVEICCAASDRVFWSAARPGQGGIGHYNEQPMDYWLRKFAHRGYGISTLNARLVEWIAENPVFLHCGWLRHNSVLLEKVGVGCMFTPLP